MTLDDGWDLYGALADLPATSLTVDERRLVAICGLRQQVNADGFDSYFATLEGNRAPDALEALSVVLDPGWAALLREAMELLGPEYPIDPDVRMQLIDDRALIDRLQELDVRFYDLEASTDADARVNAFVRATPELRRRG